MRQSRVTFKAPATGAKLTYDTVETCKLGGITFPTDFSIRGDHWKLIPVDNLEEVTSAVGMSHSMLKHVLVAPNGYAPSTQADTVLHELIHSVMGNACMANLFPKYDEEALVRLLTPGILSLICDNPKLIRAIQRLNAKGAA